MIVFRYQWLKNDQPFNVTNVNEITQTPGEGTIAIQNPRADHEGVYQCFASNEFGSAISVKTILRRAGKKLCYVQTYDYFIQIIHTLN